MKKDSKKTVTAAKPDLAKLAAASRAADENAEKQTRFAKAARKRFKHARKAYKAAKKAAKLAKKNARKARKLWDDAMRKKRRPARRRIATSVAKKPKTAAPKPAPTPSQPVIPSETGAA
jgi:hypothetical protein